MDYGEDKWISFRLADRIGRISGYRINFKDWTFSDFTCKKDYPLEKVPSEAEKLWMIVTTVTYFAIWCNGVELLKVTLAEVILLGNSCRQKFKRKPAKIIFQNTDGVEDSVSIEYQTAELSYKGNCDNVLSVVQVMQIRNPLSRL